MSFLDALRSCPKAIVVPGHYEIYADFAERVRRILETYTPAVESVELEGFYLDLAGTNLRYADFEATLRRMQAEILARTGLNVSVGAGRTKMVASIASRLEGLRGFRIVAPGTEEDFLGPVAVQKLDCVGHKHAQALSDCGVTTISQLRQVPKASLVAAFGDVAGKQIWNCARGVDDRKVLPPSTPNSISRETTLEGGTLDTDFLDTLLEYLSERIASTLRNSGKQAQTVGLQLCYVDNFSMHCTVRLPHAANQERELLAATKELFARMVRRVPIRDLAVVVANLEADDGASLDATAENRWRKRAALHGRKRLFAKGIQAARSGRFLDAAPAFMPARLFGAASPRTR